jgi:hypothetical protein
MRAHHAKTAGLETSGSSHRDGKLPGSRPLSRNAHGSIFCSDSFLMFFIFISIFSIGCKAEISRLAKTQS